MAGYSWQNKVVLVTGGTGTFGRVAIPAMFRAGVARVVVFSRDELKQGECLAAWRAEGLAVDGFIGDVRDAERLRWAMGCRPDIVVHAAALKQVPSCQYNWPEAIATNVDGTVNVAKACLTADVERAVLLSTDKACEPVNTYGKTKALAEEVFVWANAWRGPLGRTRLCVVRYGNVLGSRGSVLQEFERQVATVGELEVTEAGMRRFWMPASAAVELVMAAATLTDGGEIFVPRLTQSTVAKLADAAYPGLPQRQTGRRPGEKGDEVLISHNEADRTRRLWLGEHGLDGFAIYPIGETWPLERMGVPTTLLNTDGRYATDNSPAADLAELLAEVRS
jgi:UDP-N-acetylglucosamine 4,6-dehydratase